MRVTFVHGRSQGGKNPSTLRQEWEDSMSRGFNAARIDKPRDLKIEFPFYGNKLDDLVRVADEGSGDDAKARSAGGTPAAHHQLRGEIVQELYERSGLRASDIEFSGDAKERGPFNWKWVHAILKVLDNTSAAGAVLDTFTRDVSVYLSYPAVAKQIDELVATAIGPEPGLVVAHSLGTVVAYNVLRDMAGSVEIPLLLTLGSPLGLRSIRKKLRSPRKKPDKVDTWVNAYDDGDVVALHPLDDDSWPRAQPIRNIDDLKNQTPNQHGISGYLNQKQVARVLSEAIGP